MIVCFSDIAARSWITKEDDVVFEHVGCNVTLHSSIRGPLENYGITSWYHEVDGGRILVKSSEYSRDDVIAGDYWTNISHTIKNLTIIDSGRYFVVHQNGISECSTGSSIFLVVTGEAVSILV